MTVNLGTVTTEAQLDAAIRSADTQTVADNYTISFGGNITEGNLTGTKRVDTVQGNGNGQTSSVTITISPDLAAINLHSGVTLTVIGNGDTLIGTNGTSTFRGLFAYSGNVAINNLTIKGAVATGGAGGYSGDLAGGGGAGLGGGLFVGNTATVTLNGVYFSGDKAVGGAGGHSNSGGAGFYAGGGGMGGAGGAYRAGGANGGGGGGIGNTAFGANYGVSAGHASGVGNLVGTASGGAGASTITSSTGGATGGGGGFGTTDQNTTPNAGGAGGGGGVGGHAGATGSGSTNGVGGAGGFGGGGGGAYTAGGAGGFGGGGGAGYATGGAGGWGGGGAAADVSGGAGGFGGGAGGTSPSAGNQSYAGGGSGGGGLGAGGDIFVYKGGNLIIQSGTLSGGTVTGGAGGGVSNTYGLKVTAGSGAAGSAFGTGIFIYGSNKTVSLSPTLGHTLTISDVIADQKGVGNGTNVGNILVGDKGTVVLSKTNQFSGTSSIQNGGTLELNASGAAGSSIVTFGTGFGKLQIQSAALTNGGTFSNTVSNFVGGNVIDMTGLAFVAGASATVSAGVLKVISNSVTNAVSITSSAAGFTVIKDLGTGSEVVANTFTIANATDLTNDLLAINSGGIDSFGSVGYIFSFASNFAIASTQTINLGTGSSVTFNGGHATTGGGYEIAAGTLIAGTTGAIGSGNITVDASGTLSLSTFNQTISDLSGAGAIALGTGTLTEGSTNSTTFSGVISGTGGVVKQGAGTLTLSTSSSFTGGISLNTGELLLSAAGAAGTGKISFGASGSTEILAFSSVAVPTNVLSGLAVNGQTIEVTGQIVTAADIINTNTARVSLSTGGPLNLALDSGQSYAGDFFHFSNSGGNSFITEDTTPCYLAGTSILTDRGEVLVEQLQIGDRVITLSGQAKPIKWIGTRSYASVFAAGNRDVIPILIAEGALGDGIPARDLYVSPLHAMFLDDVLVPAEHLVNGASIVRCADIDPIRYFHIELARHDVIFADGAPAETFVDCDSRGMFHNAAAFAALYPGDASPRWAFCAPRVESGAVLERIRHTIDLRAGLESATGEIPVGPLQGHLDATRGRLITGWAFDATRLTLPVTLEVLDGDGVIARITANRYRADLEEAGIGDGRHSFELRLAHGFAGTHTIRVRRVADGAELHGSPLIIMPGEGTAMREATHQLIESAVDSAGADEGELAGLMATLFDGVEQVRRVRAAKHASPPPVSAGLIAWPADRRTQQPRALIVDDRLPRPERDAGSNAILGHGRALQSLGWQVEFVAAHELEADTEAASELEAAGFVCHRLPYVNSVEDLLRRYPGGFDLVYLHRLSNAEAYAGLSRARQPKARLVYSVADLHHVRLARQAQVQNCPEMMADARAMKQRELAAMRMVDAVITHSPDEAAYLTREAPGADVHVVPWAPRGRVSQVPLGARRGVAFIGSYRHAPNVDAVRWLAEAIMPAVWSRDRRVQCVIVGSDWPRHLGSLKDPRIRLIGALSRLDSLFDLVRLTVAPLRFGAGLKGKVLDSLASGVPCIMTPIAAEGLPLTDGLRELVADDADGLADLICDLHQSLVLHQARSDAGLAMIGSHYTDAIVRQAMARAIGTKGGSSGVVPSRPLANVMTPAMLSKLAQEASPQGLRQVAG